MYSDFLFIIAEIAAAFAGFASLVAAISRHGDRPPEQEQLDFATLQNVLMLSLLTIAFALLPNLLERQFETPGIAWRIAAATFFVAVGAYVIHTLCNLPRAYQKLRRKLPFSWRVNAGLIIAGLLGQALLASGAIPPSFYLLSLSVLLYCAGFGFVRLFVSLRPQSGA